MTLTVDKALFTPLETSFNSSVSWFQVAEFCMLPLSTEMLRLETPLPREVLKVWPAPPAHAIVGCADDEYPEPAFVTIIAVTAPRVGATTASELPSGHVTVGGLLAE